MLHLVGQLLIHISDARNHKHKIDDYCHSERGKCRMTQNLPRAPFHILHFPFYSIHAVPIQIFLRIFQNVFVCLAKHTLSTADTLYVRFIRHFCFTHSQDEGIQTSCITSEWAVHMGCSYSRSNWTRKILNVHTDVAGGSRTKRLIGESGGTSSMHGYGNSVLNGGGK